MRQNFRSWGVSLVLACIGAGCASHAAVKGPAEPQDDLPVALRGQDTDIFLDFAKHPSATLPHDLQGDEICYLTFDNAVVICTLDGSYLFFGPQDGVELISDNPLGRLRSLSRNPVDDMEIQMFGITGLVAGSVDRLPDAFADYLDDPGPYRRQALAVAMEMLSHSGATFVGSARGGTFSVSMRLADSGHDKLLEAIGRSQLDPSARMVLRSTSKRKKLRGIFGHGSGTFLPTQRFFGQDSDRG